MTPVDPDSSVGNFSRLTTQLSEQSKAAASTSIWASVRNPRLQHAQGIEHDFDAALKLMIKTPAEPLELQSVVSSVGKTMLQVREIKLYGLSTLRRHGDIMCADDEDGGLRRTAAQLFLGPVRLTFKLHYGSWKRRMEATAEGVVFAVRIKAHKERKEMKLDKLKMETFGLRIRFKGDKSFDPIANVLMIALNPLIRAKARHLLETQLTEAIPKYQHKTSLKMIRMLYGMKEKPWSGLEGRIFGSKGKK